VPDVPNMSASHMEGTHELRVESAGRPSQKLEGLILLFVSVEY